MPLSVEKGLAFYWHQENKYSKEEELGMKKSKMIVKASETCTALYHAVLVFFPCLVEALPFCTAVA